MKKKCFWTASKNPKLVFHVFIRKIINFYLFSTFSKIRAKEKFKFQNQNELVKRFFCKRCLFWRLNVMTLEDIKSMLSSLCHVVECQPENIVLQEERAVEGLQDKCLCVGVRHVVVRLDGNRKRKLVETEEDSEFRGTV